jgi:N-acyl-phosphatidylethanolamine-hydrolysing phospholipase D
MSARKFRNPWLHEPHGILDVLRWKLGLPPYDRPVLPNAPDEPAGHISLKPEDIARPPEHGWRVTWLGHASFLLQGTGVSLLVDPVFSAHCSPIPLPSLRRLVAPPCRLEELPPIDAVLLTHSHYDHLDLTTLRKLGKRTALFVPEGHAEWLGRKGFRNVAEVSWWNSVAISENTKLTATPAQHFTARSPWDRDLAHWCGWLLEGASCKLWHAGDSGYCEAFQEIGARFGPIDFGMIPIGAYEPRHIMRAMHLNPEESVKVFLETRCRRAAAMHWGTFRLTDEPLGEPPLLLSAALEKHGVSADEFVAGAIGQSWAILPVI